MPPTICRSAARGSGDNPGEHESIGDWQISGIETLLSGLPFTPQLSYNPSNDGDTRNPVRPSLESGLHGLDDSRAVRTNISTRTPSSSRWRTPTAMSAATSCKGPASRQPIFRSRKSSRSRSGSICSSAPSSSTFSIAPTSTSRIRSCSASAATGCCRRHGRRHHLDLHQFAAGSVWPEAAVVRAHAEDAI